MNLSGIEGIITASGWDDDGSVLSICLKSQNEDEFSILLDSKARTLMPFIPCSVRVQGELIQNEDDWRQKLKINEFEILKRL